MAMARASHAADGAGASVLDWNFAIRPPTSGAVTAIVPATISIRLRSTTGRQETLPSLMT